MCFILKLHSKNLFNTLLQKFMTKRTVLDCRKGKAGASVIARSPENVNKVRASVQQSPKNPSSA